MIATIATIDEVELRSISAIVFVTIGTIGEGLFPTISERLFSDHSYHVETSLKSGKIFNLSVTQRSSTHDLPHAAI